jgi:hypothetical protein
MAKHRYAFSPSLRGQIQLALWLAPALLLVLLVVAVVHPPKDRNDGWSLAALSICTAGSIPFALWVKFAFSATIEVDDVALVHRRGSRVVSIRWCDVGSVEYRSLAQRIKVISTTGTVINVEKQMVGFDEIAEIISRRTGRATVLNSPLARQVSGETAIEIAPPMWLKYISVPLVLVAAYFLSLRWFVHAWQQSRIGPVVIGVMGAWLVGVAARNWWFQLATELRKDASGIHYRDRRDHLSVAWRDIKAAGLEHIDGVTWFVVRNHQNEPILTLRREMFNWAGSAMKRFDTLVESARQRSGG